MTDTREGGRGGSETSATQGIHTKKNQHGEENERRQHTFLRSDHFPISLLLNGSTSC